MGTNKKEGEFYAVRRVHLGEMGLVLGVEGRRAENMAKENPPEKGRCEEGMMGRPGKDSLSFGLSEADFKKKRRSSESMEFSFAA